MRDLIADETLDITGLACPATYVRTIAALEEMADGQVLCIRLNGGEPARNVPRSIEAGGHELLDLHPNGDGTYTLLVRRAPE
ncbi:MAG: sulfurtransferase TusA family protein [Oscillospiraceae bacterium]|jgi:TusA-related sulfurtransferase|nr:sulfurtransferase TusA family protein [Oscillospiraceae bacterium]